MKENKMENKQETNLKQNLENGKQGAWNQVMISPDLPLIAIVDFLNILNQRLVNIENLIQVPDEHGDMHSITELYQKKEQEIKETQGE
jgi:hypothetical protein